MKRKQREYLSCLYAIRAYNKRCERVGLDRLSVCERRASVGYSALNDIIFEMDNHFESCPFLRISKEAVFMPLYTRVMEWQNGFLPFQRK